MSVLDARFHPVQKLRVLVTGATGLLGGYVLEDLARRGAVVVGRGGPSRGFDEGIDITDRDAVLALVKASRPHVVIHTAALATIAECVRDEALARRINVDGSANIADACKESRPARLIHVSTDLVFDGEAAAPYTEEAKTNPLSVYGRTKLEAEREVLARCADSVVVRTSLLFGPSKTARSGAERGSVSDHQGARSGFFDQQVETLRSGGTLRSFDDEWRTPLSLRAAAEGLVTLAASSNITGILHFGGPERLSRYEMGSRLASMLLKSSDITGANVNVATSRLAIPGEPRPRDCSLDSTKLHRACPDLATASFTAECARMMNLH